VNLYRTATFGLAPGLKIAMPTRRTTWRAVPTAILVVAAILLGAVTARADVPADHAPAAASSSAAIR
jgi:hypothetical protein